MIKNVGALKRRNDRARRTKKEAFGFRWISEKMPWLIKARSDTPFKLLSFKVDFE